MKPLKCASKLDCENLGNLGDCLFLCVFTNVINMVYVDDIVRENNVFSICNLLFINKVHLELKSNQVNQNSFKCFLPGQWR